MDINTCYELTKDDHIIAYYTHLVPIFVSIILSFYLLKKTNFSFVSKIFFIFTLSFSFWLTLDIVSWITQDYNLVTFVWSLFDYTNVIFFLFGLYFLIVATYQKDISVKWKWLGFLIMTPALWQVVTGNAIHDFDQPTCGNGLGDNFLNIYKNIVEAGVIISVIFIMIKNWFFTNDQQFKKGIAFTGLGILLFFTTFTVTDYISVATDYYQYGLYGLFILPIFLGIIVFSIVKFKLFNIRLIGAQALIATLIALIASKLSTDETGTNQIITIITLAFVSIFGYFLIQSVKKEIQAREKIAQLANDLETSNRKLRELDRQKSEFVSIASHQLRGPLTAIKGYASLVIEGDMGPVSDQVKESIQRIFKSAQSLVGIVGDFLDVSRIEQGRMKYEFANFDLKDLVESTVHEFEPAVAERGLKISFSAKPGQQYIVFGDSNKLKQVFNNFIDNSIKYTPSGSVDVTMERTNKGTILTRIKDTGVGMTQDTIEHLFEKFSRAKDASQTNVIGTGLGLFVAKEMMKAHKGNVWAESEGKGKGSTFCVEIAAV